MYKKSYYTTISVGVGIRVGLGGSIHKILKFYIECFLYDGHSTVRQAILYADRSYFCESSLNPRSKVSHTPKHADVLINPMKCPRVLHFTKVAFIIKSPRCSKFRAQGSIE